MNQTFNPSQKFLEFWAEVAAKMAAAGAAANGNASPTQAARDTRSAVFDAMSQYVDQFMRSPQFLEFARQSMDGSLQVREQLNDFLTKFRHELQGVARQDIESVLAAVHQMERRVVDRLDEIDRKLEELSGQAGGNPSRSQTRGTSRPANRKTTRNSK